MAQFSYPVGVNELRFPDPTRGRQLPAGRSSGTSSGTTKSGDPDVAIPANVRFFNQQRQIIDGYKNSVTTQLFKNIEEGEMTRPEAMQQYAQDMAPVAQMEAELEMFKIQGKEDYTQSLRAYDKKVDDLGAANDYVLSPSGDGNYDIDEIPYLERKRNGEVVHGGTAATFGGWSKYYKDTDPAARMGLGDQGFRSFTDLDLPSPAYLGTFDEHLANYVGDGISESSQEAIVHLVDEIQTIRGKEMSTKKKMDAIRKTTSNNVAINEIERTLWRSMSPKARQDIFNQYYRNEDMSGPIWNNTKWSDKQNKYIPYTKADMESAPSWQQRYYREIEGKVYKKYDPREFAVDKLMNHVAGERVFSHGYTFPEAITGDSGGGSEAWRNASLVEVMAYQYPNPGWRSTWASVNPDVREGVVSKEKQLRAQEASAIGPTYDPNQPLAPQSVLELNIHIDSLTYANRLPITESYVESIQPDTPAEEAKETKGGFISKDTTKTNKYWRSGDGLWGNLLGKPTVEGMVDRLDEGTFDPTAIGTPSNAHEIQNIDVMTLGPAFTNYNKTSYVNKKLDKSYQLIRTVGGAMTRASDVPGGIIMLEPSYSVKGYIERDANGDPTSDPSMTYYGGPMVVTKEGLNAVNGNMYKLLESGEPGWETFKLGQDKTFVREGRNKLSKSVGIKKFKSYEQLLTMVTDLTSLREIQAIEQTIRELFKTGGHKFLYLFNGETPMIDDIPLLQPNTKGALYKPTVEYERELAKANKYIPVYENPKSFLTPQNQ